MEIKANDSGTVEIQIYFYLKKYAWADTADLRASLTPPESMGVEFGAYFGCRKLSFDITDHANRTRILLANLSREEEAVKNAARESLENIADHRAKLLQLEYIETESEN